MRDVVKALIALAVLLAMFAVVGWQDAEADASYARFASCEASQSCRSAR